jgi:glucosylceramidase
LWQTAEGSKDRLTQQEDVVFSEAFAADGAVIEISGRPRHEIQGFGGAFTDAAASTMQALDKDKQDELMSSYFGPDGLGFTMGRVHINSCDFSGESYSFDDEDEDWDLKHFDKKVSHDAKALIPMIKRAQELLKEQGLNLSLLASPWSPPAWLKRSGEMDGSDKHCLRDDVDHIWANYISKWITAYEKHGIQVWAITAQNEPEYAAPWEACTWTKEEQTDFLASHLGPVIKKDHPKVLIFAFDHNKDHVHEWAKAVFGNTTSSKFTDGIAFHWYTGDGFDAVQKVHEDFPEKILLPSEATFEKASWSSGNEWVENGVWRFGEGYAHDIIGDLKAGATGWIDWNLILDQDGGPNHVDNVCDAAIIVDKDAGEFHYHPQFYFLGHFSKFIPRGSRYLETTVTGSRTYDGKPRGYGSCWPDDGIQAAAFLRPDGDVALVC